MRPAARREDVDLYIDADTASRLDAVIQTLLDGYWPAVPSRAYRRLVDAAFPLRPIAVAGCDCKIRLSDFENSHTGIYNVCMSLGCYIINTFYKLHKNLNLIKQAVSR